MIIGSESREQTLDCPVCGYDYQHHGEITVFERVGGEDGQTLSMRSSEGTWKPSDGNPSARRNGIRIYFDGECGHYWHLDIAQHKGQTFVITHVYEGKWQWMAAIRS